MDSTTSIAVEIEVKNNSGNSSKFNRKKLQVMCALTLGDLAFFSAVSIMAPFFPAEASKKDVSAAITGLIFSAYSAVIFLVSPFIGILINRCGPKSVQAYGIILTGTCNILFGFSDRLDSTIVFKIYCFTLRILEGLGAAAYSTASYTLIAKIFPGDMGLIQGSCNVATGFGLSTGPVLGAFLYEMGGFGLPFYFLGGVFVLVAGVNFTFLPSSNELDTQNDKKESESESFKKTLSVFVIFPILLTSASLVVQSIAWSFLDPTLEPHLREFNLTTSQVGLCFLTLATTFAVCSPIFGYFSDKLPRNRKWIFMSIGLVCCTFTVALLGPTPILGIQNNILINILALGLFGMSVALALVPMFELLLYYAISNGYTDDTSTYGLVGGVWTSMYSLGEIIGPFLGAVLADHFGFPVCATVIAVICFCTGAITSVYFSNYKVNKSSQGAKNTSLETVESKICSE